MSDDGRDDDPGSDVVRLGERLARIEVLLAARTERSEKSWTDAKLSLIAQKIYQARRERARHFPAELFADPAWDMLLNLFMNHVAGKRVSTTNLCKAADVPQSTCLRWIGQLKRHGLVNRHRVSEDKRLALISLTAKGYQLMRDSLPVWTEALETKR